MSLHKYTRSTIVHAEGMIRWACGSVWETTMHPWKKSLPCCLEWQRQQGKGEQCHSAKNLQSAQFLQHKNCRSSDESNKPQFYLTEPLEKSPLAIATRLRHPVCQLRESCTGMHAHASSRQAVPGGFNVASVVEWECLPGSQPVVGSQVVVYQPRCPGKEATAQEG